MAHIEIQDARDWAEQTKMALDSLETNLLAQVEAMVLGRISKAYDISMWATAATTPTLVKKIIAMFYVADLYDRQYSEDAETGSPWSSYLRGSAEALIEGIVDSTIDLIDLDPGQTAPSGSPSFYPTDASSAQQPTADDPSLGGPVFSMGTLW